MQAPDISASARRPLQQSRQGRLKFGVSAQFVQLIAGTAVPMLMHPGELFAAAVWFSLITWLMLRTRCIWDCVVAHMVSNLLMGLWVVWSGDWWLM